MGIVEKVWITFFLFILILSLFSQVKADEVAGLTPTPEPAKPIFWLPTRIPPKQPSAYLPIIFGKAICLYSVWYYTCNRGFY